MYKLLNAGFSRMRKDNVFLVIIGITIGMSIFFLLNNMSNFSVTNIDNLLVNYIYIEGLFIAMFTSLFIGKEYAYGTIRNKIIVGHSRKNIYLSNLIFSVVSGIILEMVYILIIITIGSFAIGGLRMPLAKLFFIFLQMLIVIIAHASIFNLITLLCSDMTISTTICMLLFLVTYILCSVLSATVNLSKYITNTIMDESGNIQIIETDKLNPNYPSELKMTISKIIYYSLPTGCALKISGYSLNNNDNKDIVYLFSYLSLTIVLCNFIGIYFFKRKDLR